MSDQDRRKRGGSFYKDSPLRAVAAPKVPETVKRSRLKKAGIPVSGSVSRTYSRYAEQLERPHITVRFDIPAPAAPPKLLTKKQMNKLGVRKLNAYVARLESWEKREHVRRAEESRLLAAQEFAGQRPDPAVHAAIIPVIGGDDPAEVRFAFDKHGRPFVKEKGVRKYQVPFEPLELAKREGAYLDEILSEYSDASRFEIITGSATRRFRSARKADVRAEIIRLMHDYDARHVKDPSKRWQRWLTGIRVWEGDTMKTLSAVKRSRKLRAMQRERRRAIHERREAEEKAKKEHQRGQSRERQRRKRVRDNFIN